MATQITVPTLDDIDWSKIKTSGKLQKTWKGKDGQPGSQDFCHVFFEDGKTKFAVSLTKLKSRYGVQNYQDGKNYSISFNPTADQITEIKNKLEAPLRKVLFDNRRTAMRSSAILAETDNQALFDMVRILTKPGKDKADGQGRWDPTFGPIQVPTKTRSKQTILDPAWCEIIGLNGKEYAFMSVDDKEFEDVIIELDQVTVKPNEASCKWVLRRGVVKDSAPPRYVSKRKLTQEEVPAPVPAQAAPAAAPAEEPAAKKRALPAKA